MEGKNDLTFPELPWIISPAMPFKTQERRVWMRFDNHAVVWDRDPDYGRLSRDPRGAVLRIVHIWLTVDRAEEEGVPRAYLGAVRIGSNWPRRDELRRLMRRAGACAHLAGESPRTFRRRLKTFLRAEVRS